MIRVLTLLVIVLLTVGMTSLFGSKTELESPLSYENVVVSLTDTIPLNDRFGDFLTDPVNNPFDLNDPSTIQQEIEYDPETNSYLIMEKIGEDFFRTPSFLTFDEYIELKKRQEERQYFDVLQGKEIKGEKSGLRDPIEDIDVSNTLLDRLFGGSDIEIRPQGSIDLTFGLDFQTVKNPALALRQQRQGGFDFDMAIRMNVEGKIGEKLNLSVNYNTQQTFDFDNQIKINYDTGEFSEDEIIKNIEAGNVSMPLNSQLITGAQSLFGLKTDLQFGRLRLTALASLQKSEQKNLEIQGGAQEQFFEVRADEYDENRHFFLSHFNRDNFEEALEDLPQVKSLFRIEKIQVFLTNDIQEFDNVREIVAIADLGEGLTSKITNTNPILQPPASPVYRDIKGQPLPDNNANPIFEMLKSDSRNALVDRVTTVLTQPPFNLEQGKDFDKVAARTLEPSQYSFNAELGFISINLNVQPDQVVGVSYQYSYNGQIYQVGQFSDDVATNQDTEAQGQVLFTRMLKSTTQRVDLPNWDLMMKNIYPTGAFQADPSEFFLDILYEDPEGAPKSFLPTTAIAGDRLLNVFNLDNLNKTGDPQPDGVFDYIDGVTINSRNGRMMFPKLEPFGSDLEEAIGNEDDAKDYIYSQLYNETKTDAQEYTFLNRFIISGKYKSSVSSEISLGSFNLPEGSVTVRSGGALLREGIDYEVDYAIGKLRILNDAILASGAPINVSFEDNSLFSFQQKSMVGLRADYTVNKNLTLGATYLHLFERPYTPKVNAGDDPLNNRIYGADVNWNKEAQWLTKLADKLPFYSTKEPSSFTFQAEAAGLDPGHSKAINEGNKDNNPDNRGGVVYIDDFEGATSPFSLRQPLPWKLASVPQHNNEFPEADLIDNLNYGANRAKLSWYTIQDGTNDNNTNTSLPYESIISLTEIFPNFTNTNFGGSGGGNNRAFTLNFNYYPNERGPFNFDPPGGTEFSKGSINSNDQLALAEPETRWAGVMRALPNNDFQAANYEFIEFWALSPYLDPNGGIGANPNADDNEGEILIHLGNISEDILRDSRKFFENGLPNGRANNLSRTVDTQWGKVPVQQQITDAFEADEEVRNAQDLGLDGLSDDEEIIKFDTYVNEINTTLGLDVSNDPSGDNFISYRDPEVSNLNVLSRYKEFNNTQGNSQSATNNTSTAGDQNPDIEDLNRDFTLNETESYFEYRIPIKHDGQGGIDLNSNPYLTGDIQRDDASNRVWYRFKVPLDQRGRENDFFKSVNGIQNFRAIRFMRMIMKDFNHQTNLRFARLELVRNQWRRLRNLSINEDIPGIIGDVGDAAFFDVTDVSIEENDQKEPFPYILPPGIEREQTINGVNQNALQNETALSLNVIDLPDGGGDGIFKNVAFDMRFYKGIKMFVHAERKQEDEFLETGDLSVVVRLGSDFTENYYEYELPLTVLDSETQPAYNSPDYPLYVWPEANNVIIDFEVLKQLKLERNADPNFSLRDEYPQKLNQEPFSERGEFYRIKGNPNLGTIKSVLVGIRNPAKLITQNENDDQSNHSAEVWINELRAFGLDEKGGYAATGRVDFQIADLGSVAASMRYSTQGFGALDQTLLERSREEIINFDWSANVELGKFLPEKSGIRVPFYYQYSHEVRTPQFDPYDRDIELDTKLDNFSAEAQDSIKEQAKDITKIRSYNFTNVRKERTNPEKKPLPWNIENFSFDYSKTKIEHSDPIVESENIDNYSGGINYNYSTSSKYIKPFKGISKSKWLKLITEFNFNPIPSSFGFNTIMNRSLGETKYRFAGTNPLFNTFYQKNWTWDRAFNLNWDLSRNLKFSFDSNNSTVIDEAPRDVLMRGGLNESYRGAIDTQEERDVVWDNIKNFGRDKNYQHNFSASLTLPTKHIPILDWTTVKASYTGSYNWSASALNLQDSLGNVIQNSQNRQLNFDLDFVKLYRKSDFLSSVDKGNRRSSKTSRGETRQGRKPERDELTENKDKDKKDKQANELTKKLVRPLLLIRKGRFTYSENFGTVIPGFMQNNPKFLGLSDQFNQPGFGFVSGIQPNLNLESYYGPDDYLYNNYNWISSSLWQSQQVSQTYGRDYNAKVNIEPFKDFKLDLELNSEYNEFHTETFKRDTIFQGTDPTFGASQAQFHHLNPKELGSYNISFFAMNTFLKNEQGQQQLFADFKENWLIIADRIGSNAIPHLDSLDAAEGFPFGYGRDQQDVLIPAFIAAYTGKDVNSVKTDVFDLFPKINWKLTYNGLSKIPAIKDVFKKVSIRHGYRSNLQINRFQTDLLYDPEDENALNPETNNYFSRYEIPDIVISEQFSPLLGVGMEFNNSLNINVDFKRSRNLQMSLQRFNLSETQSQEYVIGVGYKLNDVNIPFLTRKKKSKKKKKEETEPVNGIGLNNRGRSNRGGSAQPGDLDLNLDFSVRDDITRFREFYSEVTDGEPTRGSNTIQISPYAEYRISNQLSVRLFFDYRRNKPKTSQGYPITTTQGGVMIRFTLQ